MEKSIKDNFDEDCEEAEKQVRMISKPFTPILKSDRKTIIADIEDILCVFLPLFVTGSKYESDVV